MLESLNLPLVSPSCANPLGAWMTEFMGNATSKCFRVDWIGADWYGGTSATNFRENVMAVHETYGLPRVDYRILSDGS